MIINYSFDDIDFERQKHEVLDIFYLKLNKLKVFLDIFII